MCPAVSTITTDQSTFSDISASAASEFQSGGAVYAPPSNITINLSIFSGNLANGYGGAIYVSFVAVNMSTFDHNAASGSRYRSTVTSSGRAIYGETVTVDRSTFSYNTVSARGGRGGGGGGGIRGTETVTVERSVFSYNTASYYSRANGGAI